MESNDLQTWMLIAFFITMALGMYKIYILFDKSASGPDLKTEHAELSDIIIAFIQNNEISVMTNEALFRQMTEEASSDTHQYKNFNLNRFNQLIQQLFYTYDVSSLAELIESINAQKS